MADGTIDVREFGATGEGDERETDALQAALDAAAEGGATVHVPPGEYRTGPLRVGDDTTLHLAPRATIQFVGDHEAFPIVESRWEGWEVHGFHPCLWVDDAENVAITGRGTIDGGGSYWWQYRGAPRSEYPDALRDRLEDLDERNKSDDVSSFTVRPPLLQIRESENVRIQDVTLRNSPFWNTHVVFSEDVSIRGVRIENPHDAPNGDGIDVDSSRFVRISDAYISAGDDAICLKSGKDAEGREVGRPCAQITVTGCTVRRGHGGVVIGSEMSGDVRDVTVTGCTFTNTDRGIRIKTQRGRGGVVEDLTFSDIVMRGVVCPFVMNGYYFTDVNSPPEPVTDETPAVRNVRFHDIVVREACSAAFVAGLPELPFSGVHFHDVEIDATLPFEEAHTGAAMADNYEPRHGVFCRTVEDVTFDDVRVRTREGPAFEFEAAERIDLDGFRADAEAADPAIRMQDVADARLRETAAPEGIEYLRVEDGETRDVAIETADLPDDAVTVADGADVEFR